MIKRNIVIVTGGTGFVGSNLINLLINKTNYKIISLDNYSSGSKKNHLKNRRIKYINANTKDIFKIIKNPNLSSLESSIEEKTGIKVFIRNKRNNAGQVTFEYKDLDQLNRLIMVIKANY